MVQAVLTVVVAAYSLTLRRQDAQRLRDLAAVRAAERLELSRELHDLVAHHVTGIVVQARAARCTGLEGPPADATFERIETAGSEALGAMRRLVRVLREDGTRAYPLAGLAEVRAMTDTFARTGPPVVLALETAAAHALPAEVAAAVHRIVREALTNIRKHAADATAVRIGLRSVPRGVELRVANDGGAPARLFEQAPAGAPPGRRPGEASAWPDSPNGPRRWAAGSPRARPRRAAGNSPPSCLSTAGPRPDAPPRWGPPARPASRRWALLPGPAPRRRGHRPARRTSVQHLPLLCP